MDGYKQEIKQSRIQRLRIEKEEETKIEWMVRRRVKECERELKKTQEEVMAEKEQTIKLLRQHLENEKKLRKEESLRMEKKEEKELIRQEKENEKKMEIDKERDSFVISVFESLKSVAEKFVQNIEEMKEEIRELKDVRKKEEREDKVEKRSNEEEE